jgi:Skp family chaperone for outer membrane proteins
MKQALFLCILLAATFSVAQEAKAKDVACRQEDDVFQKLPDGKYYRYNVDVAYSKGELSENSPKHNPICLPTDSVRMIWYTNDPQKKVKVKGIAPSAGDADTCKQDNNKPFRDDPRNAKADKFIVSDVAQADFNECSYEVQVQYDNASGDPHIYVGGGGTAKLQEALQHAQEELAFWQKEVSVLQQKLQAAASAHDTAKEK